MLLYHFPLTSSSATATIVNKGLKDDYTISGDNNFSSGGKLSAYAKDMGENKFYLSIPNFSLDYTLCFRAKATSNISLVSVGYTPFEITADNTWHDYVICDKKVYKDGLFLTNYNYSAGIVAFGDSEESCQGLIQDIRIYDYALSQAEINEYSRALVVHYPLQGNELNTNVLKDVSGFGNDNILNSIDDVNLLNDAPRGFRSTSFGLKWFKVKNRTTLKKGPVKGKTFSWWYKPLAVTGSSTLSGMQFISFTYQSKQSWLSYVFLLENRNEINNIQGVYFKSDNGDWVHCVAVIDDVSDSVIFYKNGSLFNRIYRQNITQTNAKDGLFLGEVSGIFRNPWSWGNPPNLIYSAFSDFRIYATALSVEDIKNLYNSPISVSKQHQTMAFEFVEGNDGFSAKNNGIVQHNELRENDSDVNGCYNDKLITNELIEN